VWTDFWRWDALEDYLVVLAAFFWALSCLAYAVRAYGDTRVLAEVLGALSVACEIAFPLPQVRHIFATGSAAGVRCGPLPPVC
jgi:hypothetical protein